MKKQNKVFNSKQLIFKDTFVGAFIYAVTLGFFNDYTDIVDARSFSTIFYASIVLEILTFLTFMLKSRIIDWLKSREGIFYKAMMFFCVWLVMFLSKFVFIWSIDLIFGANMSIHGFFGILFVALSAVITHKLADKIFIKLGDSQ